MDKNIKFFSDGWIIQKSAKEDDRILHFIASKEIVDRDFDIVSIKGLDITNFKNNPVILLNHNSSGLPIGKAVKIWRLKDELHVKIQFADLEEYEVADTAYKLLKGGYLKSLSIRFLPDYSKIEYIETKPGDTKSARRIYKSSELLEISVVTVPSNAAALLQAKSKMIEEKVFKSEDEVDKFVELCKEVKSDDPDASNDELKPEQNKNVEPNFEEKLNKITKELAIILEFIKDLNQENINDSGSDLEPEEKSYFEELFKNQDNGPDTGLKLSNDEKIDSKEIFEFLNEDD